MKTLIGADLRLTSQLRAEELTDQTNDSSIILKLENLKGSLAHLHRYVTNEAYPQSDWV